jgi:hypothetical protein
MPPDDATWSKTSMSSPRSRIRLLGATLIVIVVGLGTRQPFAPPFVQLYLGDVLWGALFFLLGALRWPRWSSWALGGWAVATTQLIELSQLYQADWAVRLRATRAGGMLLGHQFVWSDLMCVSIGGALAALLDARGQRLIAAKWWRWRSCSST